MGPVQAEPPIWLTITEIEGESSIEPADLLGGRCFASRDEAVAHALSLDPRTQSGSERVAFSGNYLLDHTGRYVRWSVAWLENTRTKLFYLISFILPEVPFNYDQEEV